MIRFIINRLIDLLYCMSQVVLQLAVSLKLFPPHAVPLCDNVRTNNRHSEFNETNTTIPMKISSFIVEAQ